MSPGIKPDLYKYQQLLPRFSAVVEFSECPRKDYHLEIELTMNKRHQI